MKFKKIALALSLALLGGACDSDEGIRNIPPSPRLELQGTVELTDADDNSAEYAATGQEVVADATDSFDAQQEAFELAFELERPEGSSAELTVNEAGDVATITPDVPGDYAITLVATDAIDQSQQKTLAFKARDNAAPSAALKADELAVVGVASQLDATESVDGEDDALDDDLSYEWKLYNPNAKDVTKLLGAASGAMVQFTPEMPGDYQARLIVSDGFAKSEELVIDIPTRDNGAPTADAVRQTEGLMGQAVQLDGSASSDPDEDELTIEWTLFAPDDSNATDMLVEKDTLTPSFVPNATGTWRAVLSVTDEYTEPSTDEVLITVTDAE